MRGKIINALAATAFVITLTAADAQTIWFTTKPDKTAFAISEPVEVTSQISVLSGSRRLDAPEALTGNVVYDVERLSEGTWLPHKQSLLDCSGGRSWGGRAQDVNPGTPPLTATFDMRILYRFEAGRYRVRGKYRTGHPAYTPPDSFEKISDWSEFEVLPQTEREAKMFQDWELTGAGETEADKLASYEAFAAKYPSEYLTAKAYDKIRSIYRNTGRAEDELALCKQLINSPNLSKIARRRLAYTIGAGEEKNGRLEEAVQWYRQSALPMAEDRLAKLLGEAR
jgi:hypothetical protein